MVFSTIAAVCPVLSWEMKHEFLKAFACSYPSCGAREICFQLKSLKNKVYFSSLTLVVDTVM